MQRPLCTAHLTPTPHANTNEILAIHTRNTFQAITKDKNHANAKENAVRPDMYHPNIHAVLHTRILQLFCTRGDTKTRPVNDEYDPDASPQKMPQPCSRYYKNAMPDALHANAQ